MSHKTDMNVTEILNSLRDNFTGDAIFLIGSYFNRLQNKLETSGVPQTKQEFILKGLYYYITEYIEDHSHKKSIISFETALNILNEIGSPMDIIQTLSFRKDSQMSSITKSESFTISKRKPTSELPQKVSYQTVCQYCHTSNESSSNYCEKCGKDLLDKQNFLQNIKQEIIDHSYFATFLLSWLGFAILQVLFEIELVL